MIRSRRWKSMAARPATPQQQQELLQLQQHVRIADGPDERDVDAACRGAQTFRWQWT